MEIENFDKTLTPEEVAAESYLEWSNETLGRCVRSVSEKLKNTEVNGFKGIMTMAAVHLLIRTATEVNADEMKQTCFGFTIKNKPFGNWEVRVRKIKSKKK